MSAGFLLRFFVGSLGCCVAFFLIPFAFGAGGDWSAVAGEVGALPGSAVGILWGQRYDRRSW